MASDQPKQFLFLNQSPTSEPRSQREKELQDADRRAHAARNSTAKRRLALVEGAPSAASTSRRVLRPARPARKKPLVLRPRKIKKEEPPSSPSQQQSLLTSTASLGQGNHDPFDSAAVSGLPSFIYSSLEHCFRHVWPTLSCSDPRTEAKFAIERKQVIRDTPYMLHAYITNATGHNLRLYPPGHPARTLLSQAKSYHERKALETISNMLQTQTTAVTDRLLVALFIVVFPAGDYDDAVSKYPVSPLAEAQSINLYTNMDVTPGMIRQIQSLSRLLETRGNLDGVAYNDWVHAVILADAFVASRLGVRPIWTWPTTLQHLFEAFASLVLDAPAFQLSLVLGHGFSRLKHAELLNILHLACRTTLALDLHHRAVPNAPKIWEIGKVRNAIQHKLCCLDPPETILPSYDESLYNMVRLAALIYSDLVLFPLGESVSVKPRLAYDLRKALELLLSADDVDHQAERDLIVWCITMGAMASYDTVHQEWYVERLSEVVRDDERLLDWTLFQTGMQYYLWWAYVLQPRCWDIWSEAVQLVRPEQANDLAELVPLEMENTPGSTRSWP